MSFSLYLLGILVVTMLVTTFVVQKNVVDGDSMNPTLSDADQLLTDKLSYRLGDPQRFDIIVFPYEHEKGVYYVKRIIGMPGESIRIDVEGRIFINGELLEEKYGNGVIKDPGIAVSDYTLGKNEYFVLGDNRNDSIDSRFIQVGPVKREKILGRALYRIWPLGGIGKI